MKDKSIKTKKIERNSRKVTGSNDVYRHYGHMVLIASVGSFLQGIP